MKKYTLLLALFVFAFNAYADDHEGEGGGSLEEKKTEMIQNIDKHSAQLTEAKACVTAATTKDELKACHKKNREMRKENRMGRTEKRMEKLEQRKQRAK